MLNVGITLVFLSGFIVGFACGNKASDFRRKAGVWVKLERIDSSSFRVSEIVNGGDAVSNVLIQVTSKP
jgi:hypothetical protein